MRYLWIFVILGATAFGQNAYGPDFLNLHCTAPDPLAQVLFNIPPRPGLVPDHSANGNVVLYCDAATGTFKASFNGNTYVSVGGGSPGGGNNSVQFNNSGILGGLANVAAGSALVSNGASSSPFFQTKQALDVRDFGADCTDTNDSTTAIANAITAAGNFGKIVFPAKCKVKVSGTPAIFLHDVQGLEMEMLGRQGNGCDQSGSSFIDYQQTYASGNTVISILDSQRLRLRNLVIYANGNADNGILIDQDLSTPPITTDNIFEGICIYNNTGNRNSSWNGINMSPVSTSNVESQRFRDIFVLCSQNSVTSATSNGNGFNLPQNSNAVNEEISYFGSLNCSKTLNSPGGQELSYSHLLDSTGTTNTNFVVGALNTALMFSRFENSNIGVQQTSSSPFGPTLIMGNDFTNLTTVMDCPTAGCGGLTTVINNEKDATPANWFNLHTNRANSGLFAVNNRNFSWTPTDWNNGGFVFPDLSLGAGQPNATLTLPLRMTPRLKDSDFVSNFGSPYIDLQSNSGSTPQVDDYYIQQMPTGPFGAVTASTLIFGHSPTNGVTPWFSFQGTISGVNTNAISNPFTPTITNFCSGGTSTWTYQVVAHDSTGTTAGSTTASTTTGCLSLASGGNKIAVPGVAGCTFFDIYRTAVPGGGTPNTTGKIGQLPCYSIGILNVAADSNASGNIFFDNGLAGDSSTAPGTNTTGTWVFNKGINSALYSTVTNCQLGGATGTASPAACVAAPSGSVAIPASQTSYVVNTTAVTANSHIFVQQITDNSGISTATCNAGATTPIQSARTAGTSFTITLTSVASVTCIQYWIIN